MKLLTRMLMHASNRVRAGAGDWPRRVARSIAGVLLLAGCLAIAETSVGASTSMFDPASPPAVAIDSLTRLVIVLVVAIGGIVEAVLVYSLVRFRRRRGQSTAEPAQVYGSDPIELAWTAAPALIVFVLVLIVARTEWEVRADVPEPAAEGHDLMVRVIGHQWWWEYVYESYEGRSLKVIAANELHVPASDPGTEGVKRAVYLTLESADVCHSFWVPRLAGKTDLIPGRTNRMWFQCAEPGIYLGQCAEYCGTQHAGMLLRVSVDTPEDFQSWLDQQTAIAIDDEGARAGRDAFFAHACVNCHRIGGTTARGTFGPDLTHLASRQTLAAGVCENTADSLRGWIRNPQAVKPGALMPDFGLSDREVNQIVRYLLTLR